MNDSDRVSVERQTAPATNTSQRLNKYHSNINNSPQWGKTKLMHIERK